MYVYGSSLRDLIGASDGECLERATNCTTSFEGATSDGENEVELLFLGFGFWSEKQRSFLFRSFLSFKCFSDFVYVSGIVFRFRLLSLALSIDMMLYPDSGVK